MNRCITALALLAGALSAGCAALQPPQPWQKAELARPVMRMDTDPLESAFFSHVYFSKEDSKGGDGVGGGGCGCN
ncbi:MAG TPA: DUF4266 domain-containing protein [Burkholderiaceae bacterium]